MDFSTRTNETKKVKIVGVWYISMKKNCKQQKKTRLKIEF